MNIMYYKMVEHLDEEGRLSLDESLNKAALIRHPLLQSRRPRLRAVPTGAPATVVAQERWRAPEGWQPPGWNEERSYKAAQSFIGFQKGVDK